MRRDRRLSCRVLVRRHRGLLKQRWELARMLLLVAHHLLLLARIQDPQLMKYDEECLASFG